MGNLANKLNKAYAGEVKQTLKAISRSKELESLKLTLEETKKYDGLCNWVRVSVGSLHVVVCDVKLFLLIIMGN
ncbi:hypothetical protein L3X38_025218 [Prunus dulcis]|uniref:Uncharacterized protein n=1 Tax=Prunus dulcis TaxID=3755 RepID=A0AAD4W192_PRUDU|nr:hypothetical protein L3X38_025218 [Prunus dulcis]